MDHVCGRGHHGTVTDHALLESAEGLDVIIETHQLHSSTSSTNQLVGDLLYDDHNNKIVKITMTS